MRTIRTSPLATRGLTLPAMVTLVLVTVLAVLVVGASAVSAQGSAPDTPDQPIGTVVFVGGVDLEWNDVAGADSYDVQLYRNGQWLDLPGDGVEIAFYGAGAIISGLDPDSTLWFQVRAKNAHGFSNWSNFSSMASTNQFRLGRRARPDNVPASGAPLINGTAQVGESLTADTTGIEDGNGLDRVQFRFQWVSHDGSSDTDIASAMDSTYTLAASDEGKTIKVRVAFTDRGGYAESLTGVETSSVAARPNSPATGAPAVTGTAQVGETLTADTSGIADADGLTKVSYSYQWVANDGTADSDISGETDAAYTLAAADEGKTVKVKVSFTDDAGNGETLTSSATAAVEAAPNTPATGAPAISGTAQVGETLTADTSGISDADGLASATFAYQWLADDAELAGATGGSYVLTTSEMDKIIKVHVSFTDDAGKEETLISTATGTVNPAVQPQTANSPATGAPIITGTAEVREILTASTSGIADDDGLANAIYSYQWIANDGGTDADISGETDATYTLVADDVGKTIKVRVTIIDDAGNEATLTSAATETVGFAVQQQGASNTPTTGEPTITGAAQVGEMLTVDTSGIADDDGLNNVTYSYQWVANDGTTDTDIFGATDSTYTLAAADEGKTIKVRVSFTDDATNEESLASAATGAVAAAPPSYITVFVSDDRSDPNNIVTNFTVIWNDSGDCSTNYNAYLNIEPETRPGHETPGSQLHLGSAPSDGAQITKGLTGIQRTSAGSYVELYCGTDGSGRSVSIVGIPGISHPMPSTYSSAPLTALTISSGTLSPDFDRGIYLYTAEVPSDVALITLNPVVLTGFQTDIVKDPSGLVVQGCSTYCYAFTYGDGTTYGIVLSDADTSTDGFQVNLTALTISSGTLSPDFDRGIYLYTAEVPSDVALITLNPVVLTGFQTDIVKDPSGYVGRACSTACYAWVYGDGTTYGIVLSDADTSTDGFQVNLDPGENRLLISVHKGPVRSNFPKTYNLTVTVQNSPPPARTPPPPARRRSAGRRRSGRL